MKKLIIVTIAVFALIFSAGCGNNTGISSDSGNTKVNSKNIESTAKADKKESPDSRKLKVIIKDERTAEFRLSDPDLQKLYQVSQNLNYVWEIRFDEFTVETMSPYVDGLKSLSVQEMNHSFIKSGKVIGGLCNGEPNTDVPFSFKLDGNTMVWTVHMPEYNRSGEGYDTQAFDFRNFKSFSVKHFKIENNNASHIYEDNYSADKVVFDSDVKENYNIQPIPTRFSSGDSDSKYFTPVTTNYVITQMPQNWGTRGTYNVDTNLVSLYSLNENGIIVAESYKLLCKSAKDADFLVNGAMIDGQFTSPIVNNALHVSGDTVYIDKKESIGKPPYIRGKDIAELKKQSKDGYTDVDDTKVYFSETK